MSLILPLPERTMDSTLQTTTHTLIYIDIYTIYIFICICFKPNVFFQTICKPAPFSTDEEAVRERERCDYTHRITYQMARSGEANRRVRVYADGIYDLFHQGHARQLMQVDINRSKKSNELLIIDVCPIGKKYFPQCLPNSGHLQ